MCNDAGEGCGWWQQSWCIIVVSHSYHGLGRDGGS